MELFVPRFRRAQDQFPNRTASNIRKTSEIDLSYNCFGWVLGKTEVLSWTSSSSWPGGIGKNFLVHTIIELYERYGFEECGQDGTLEDGIEKIAIFTDGTFLPAMWPFRI